MSDSGSDDDSVDWVMYRDRPDWADLKPIPQDDGPFPVVAIAYSEKFRDVYDYFRAVLQSNELSERALTLTKDALSLNAANYTVWEYRRKILSHLGKDLWDELQYVSECIEANPKNYQVWHHRMILVQILKDPRWELKFIADMLSTDPKNYHAWQYRQWILSKFKLFKNELDFTHKLLEEDVRNNSAWNQRYFVLNHTTDFSEESIQKEVDYTLEAIDRVRKNESAWNYLQGILFHSENGLLEPRVIAFCNELYLNGERSNHLLAYLVDAAIEEMDLKKENYQEKLEQALRLCKELSEEHDRMHAAYWEYMANTLRARKKEPQP